MRKRITIAAAMIVPLLAGCAGWVSPAMRTSMETRLDYARRAVEQGREELGKLGAMADRNQREWARNAAQVEGWPVQDQADTAAGLESKARDRERFLAQLGRAEKLIESVETDLGGERP